MQIYQTCDKSDEKLYALLRERAKKTSTDITEKVAAVIEDVKKNKDEALFRYSELFDHVKLSKIEMDEEEIQAALSKVPKELTEALKKAAENIRAYHEKQLGAGYEIGDAYKKLTRLLRHQMGLTKPHFDELSVNESETHGLNFP